MKLNRKMIHLRIGRRNLEHLRVIQSYKSKTATSIIEDALEKGLAWYLKQISGELGRTKENPLTWEALAELVKLSETNQKNDNQEEEPKKEVTDEEVDKALAELF